MNHTPRECSVRVTALWADRGKKGITPIFPPNHDRKRMIRHNKRACNHPLTFALAAATTFWYCRVPHLVNEFASNIPFSDRS